MSKDIKNKKVEVEEIPDSKEFEIEIGNPQLLRPVDLPLVIKPANGAEWKNEAQAQYAQVLNAYAYKNVAKWEIKKATLIKQLEEIGEDPSKLSLYRGGGENNVSFKNRLIG